jgi:hypothetical protein
LRRGERFDQRVVKLELFLEQRSILREPLQIVVSARLLTDVSTKAELAVDQVQGHFHVRGDRGIPREVGLGGDGLAGVPALPLVDVQHLDQLLVLQCAEACKEIAQLGSLAISPKVAKLFGRVRGGDRRHGTGVIHGITEFGAARLL